MIKSVAVLGVVCILGLGCLGNVLPNMVMACMVNLVGTKSKVKFSNNNSDLFVILHVSSTKQSSNFNGMSNLKSNS